ncbi:MAG: NAD(P)-dependent oxidoreductase [Rubrivivax sp.]|nr:NAD(P)-dependent oxidoreductase [Rubrivivax sp.]
MILVTGSTGHLGEGLMRTLRGAGRAARGLDLLPSPWTDLTGTLADRGLVARAMQGVTQVIHCATLHKPHVATHTRQDFIDTNISGTLNLLEEAVLAGVGAFVFTSTTSAFGDALEPPAGAPAAWIDESVRPVPKNIYGVTKIAAEDLCELAHRNQSLACVVLRTSRFFPEGDDNERARSAFIDANLKLNELLHRRLDVEDCVDAHLCALQAAPRIGFGRFIVSAPTPFTQADRAELRRDAPAVLDRRVPGWRDAYASLGWYLPTDISRVYDSSLAREVLGWEPKHRFDSVLQRALARQGDIRSDLARTIGLKGYHGQAPGDVRYPLS